jgi:hypothetical protein
LQNRQQPRRPSQKSQSAAAAVCQAPTRLGRARKLHEPSQPIPVGSKNIRRAAPRKHHTHTHTYTPLPLHDVQESDPEEPDRQADSWRGPGVAVATGRPSPGFEGCQVYGLLQGPPSPPPPPAETDAEARNRNSMLAPHISLSYVLLITSPCPAQPLAPGTWKFKSEVSGAGLRQATTSFGSSSCP